MHAAPPPFVAHRGNYKNYSGSARFFGENTNAHVPDARLTVLHRHAADLFAAQHILDIGSNTGYVSVALVQHFAAAAVRGVDIDGDLVARAKLHLATQWSRTGPAGERDFFPLDSVSVHGRRPFPPLPQPLPAAQVPLPWPRNVQFAREDFAARDARPDEAAAFGVVLALSVAKWVHLHAHDAGLRRWFAKCWAVLAPGGRFVLEAQEWASYEKAVKKVRELRRDVEQLRLRPDDFPRLLEELGFVLVLRLPAGAETGLKRGIDVYEKPR